MTAPRTPTTHAQHDLLLIAALADRAEAAGDPPLSARERAMADAQLASCADCAGLHADLRALAAATPSSAMPTRPRDFTLSQADADRLRPRGLRGLMRWIGSPRDAFSRPLAIGLTTMGLAGLLVATVPGAFSGAASSGAALPQAGAGPSAAAPAPAASAAAPAPSAAPSVAAAAAPSAAPSGAPEALQNTSEPEAPATDDRYGVFTGEDAGEGAADTAQRQNDLTADGTDSGLFALRDDPSGMSTLLVVAGTLLIVGLGLFALRWSARRLDDG